MPYTIDGASYKEIAERRFAADRTLNRFENKMVQLPFVDHSMQHTFSRNFDIIRFKADFQKDLRITGVRDKGHVSLHFQRKGHSKAIFKGIKNEHPLLAGEYNMYYSDAFLSDLEFDKQTDFEYLAITLQTDYLLSILEQAGGAFTGIQQSIRSGGTFALADKALTINPELNMALYSLLHTPVADPLTELFLNSKITEIITLQLSQYSGSAQPAADWSSSAPSRQLKEVYEYINTHYLSIYSLADAVKHFPLSEHELKRGLRQHYQTTLYEMVHQKRMLHAMQLLKDTDMHVNEVAWEVGYSNATNFIQAFKRSFSITPRQAKSA